MGTEIGGAAWGCRVSSQAKSDPRRCCWRRDEVRIGEVHFRLPPAASLHCLMLYNAPSMLRIDKVRCIVQLLARRLCFNRQVYIS